WTEASTWKDRVGAKHRPQRREPQPGSLLDLHERVLGRPAARGVVSSICTFARMPRRIGRWTEAILQSRCDWADSARCQQGGGWRMTALESSSSAQYSDSPESNSAHHIDATPRPERPSRILIAEDDEPTRRLLADWLEQEGYVVEQAADGWQALQAVTDFSPDLIVLDVKLPALDGLEVARRLQARSRGSGGLPIPILMLSGLGEDVDRVAGLSAGADDYVTKPVRPRELLLRIQGL